MSLQSRVARLEVVGAGGAPSDQELVGACQLLDRHFLAVHAAAIFGPGWATEPDSAEVVLMQAAEASGRIAAAREVVRRHARAHGRDDPYPTKPEDRERRARARMAELERVFGARP